MWSAVEGNGQGIDGLVLSGPRLSGKTTIAFRLAYEIAESGERCIFICRKAKIEDQFPRFVMTDAANGSSSWQPATLNRIDMLYPENEGDFMRAMASLGNYNNPPPSAIIIDDFFSFFQLPYQEGTQAAFEKMLRTNFDEYVARAMTFLCHSVMDMNITSIRNNHGGEFAAGGGGGGVNGPADPASGSHSHSLSTQSLSHRPQGVAARARFISITSLSSSHSSKLGHRLGGFVAPPVASSAARSGAMRASGDDRGSERGGAVTPTTSPDSSRHPLHGADAVGQQYIPSSSSSVTRVVLTVPTRWSTLAPEEGE